MKYISSGYHLFLRYWLRLSSVYLDMHSCYADGFTGLHHSMCLSLSRPSGILLLTFASDSSWRSGSFWNAHGITPLLCLSSASSKYSPIPGCLDTLATCCSRSPRFLTCRASLRRKRVWIASTRDVSPHFSAIWHSRSRSSRIRFSTEKASRHGWTGSTGESGHSHLGASIAVGRQRPPRVTRYFSIQWKSIRHSLALLSNSLFVCQHGS